MTTTPQTEDFVINGTDRMLFTSVGQMMLSELLYKPAPFEESPEAMVQRNAWDLACKAGAAHPPWVNPNLTELARELRRLCDDEGRLPNLVTAAGLELVAGIKATAWFELQGGGGGGRGRRRSDARQEKETSGAGMHCPAFGEGP